MKKRCLGLFLLLNIFLGLSAPALALAPPSLQLNGTVVDVRLVLKDRRAYLPCQDLIGLLDAEAEYRAADKTIIVTRDGVSAALPAACREGEVLYLPVRAAAEGLGCSVGWDREHPTVLIADIPCLAPGGDMLSLKRASLCMGGVQPLEAPGALFPCLVDTPEVLILRAIPLTSQTDSWPLVCAAAQALAAGKRELYLCSGDLLLQACIETPEALSLSVYFPLESFAPPDTLSRLGPAGEEARLVLALSDGQVTAQCTAGSFCISAAYAA